MKFAGMPAGMWALFKKSFRDKLVTVLGFSEREAEGMSEAGGACDFIRENTLASGGPYCDCGYKKKARTNR
ncbi:MAG: hypothetical protein IJ899_00135 [Blautia sp.]|nr:hypothetical protein [Blautia sp.]